ncbi:MAG: N-acetyltransferase [Alphaproteobacteria bacterium]|nr:N-acetyltransferase [Alphaproteobacteria bacterium]
MTDDIAIAHEAEAIHGRYVTRLDSGEAAEMTYVIRAPGVRDFNHTFVPDAFRGTGIAARLMARAIADAKTEGFRIVPTCSYVAAQFRRHPEWSEFKA